LVKQLVAAPCTQRGDVEVVIVDNHSPAHPLARRLRRWPGVSLRRWGRNRGFAQAVNEGCRLSQGDWLLLLNPDISVRKTFLDDVLALVDRLARDEPRAGIIGFQLRNSDGTAQLSSGPFPTMGQMLARLTLPRHRRKYHFLRAKRFCRVPWVTGCCLLLRRTCLEQLGGLDPDFFLYYEDVDLCRRARARDWSVYYEPGLRVTHHHPLHLRVVPAHLRVLTRHALLTYASKHWPWWQFRLLAGLVRTEASLRQKWAIWQRDNAAAQLFGALGAISADMASGRAASARRRLDQIVRREEQSHAAVAVSCHP
jgi:GT2 family glycosyltransferase